MRGWRLLGIGVLGLVAMLTCACVMSSRSSKEARLAEDLQKDELSVGFRLPMAQDELTVNVTDEESSAKIVEWFHKTPRGSNALGMRLQQSVESGLMENSPIASTRFETSRFRVRTLMTLIVLETRSSPDGEWKQVAWEQRPEDKELCNWLASQYGRELMVRNFESQNPGHESPEHATPVVPVGNQELEE